MLSRLSTLGGLFAFMVQGSRKFWLLPLVIALTLVILVIIFGAAAQVLPFLYPLI